MVDPVNPIAPVEAINDGHLSGKSPIFGNRFKNVERHKK